MEFSRQEYWSELPFPSAADVPDRETEPIYPVSTGRFYLFIYFYHWATWVWALQLNAFLIWILVSFWVCRPHSWVCHHPEVEDSVCVCVCVCVCVLQRIWLSFPPLAMQPSVCGQNQTEQDETMQKTLAASVQGAQGWGFNTIWDPWSLSKQITSSKWEKYDAATHSSQEKEGHWAIVTLGEEGGPEGRRIDSKWLFLESWARWQHSWHCYPGSKALLLLSAGLSHAVAKSCRQCE